MRLTRRRTKLSRTGINDAARFDARLHRHFRENIGVAERYNHVDGTALFVDEFEASPFEGAVTLATRGVSELPDPTTRSGLVMQELVFTAYAHHRAEELAAMLMVIAGARADDGHLHVGRLLALGDPIVPGATVDALYVASPFYWGSGLYELDVDGDVVTCLQLAPVHGSEGQWLEEHGYEAFVDVFLAREPDLYDLARAPLELPATT